MVQSEKVRADKATEGATGRLSEAWLVPGLRVDVRWATALNARCFNRGAM